MKATHVVYRHTTPIGKYIIRSRHTSYAAANLRAAAMNDGRMDSPWRVADVSPTGTHELVQSDMYGLFMRIRSR